MEDEDWRLASCLAVSLVSVGVPQPNTAAVLASSFLSQAMNLVTDCNTHGRWDLICCYQFFCHQKLLILVATNHAPNTWIEWGLWIGTGLPPISFD